MMRKDKKRPQAEAGTISTLLGRDIELEGTLTFNDTIRVDGRIKGHLVSTKGTVIIGENAIIDADIKVGIAIVRGTVNGRIEASERIEVYAPAKVNGDITAPTVTIDSGVVFNGKCEMQGGDPTPVKKIKSAVESPKETPLEDEKVVKKL